MEELTHSRNYGGSTPATPKSHSTSSAVDGPAPPFMSTPVAKPPVGIKARLGPRPQASPKTPAHEVKIDSSSFVGLFKSNRPETRAETEDEDSTISKQWSRHVSVSSVASQDDGIHFEPLIPLSEKIEVETGEEEEALFTSRAKLLCFDKETSFWKELGLGAVKILHNSVSGKYRVLMRCENIHKVCVNHHITPEMKLEFKADSTNSLVWMTFADFADEVAKVKQLAAKFKTPEDASAFKDTFEECQETLRTTKPVVSQQNSPRSIKEEEDEDDEDEDDKVKELKARFVPKPGSWSCTVCLVPNVPEMTMCVACGTAKLSLPVSSIDASKISFSCQSSQLPFRFPRSGSMPVSSEATQPPLASSTLSFGASPHQYSFGTPCSVSPGPVALMAQMFTQPQSGSAASTNSTVPSFTLAPFKVPALNTAASPSTFVFGSASLGDKVAAPQPNKLLLSFSTTPVTDPQPGPVAPMFTQPQADSAASKNVTVPSFTSAPFREYQQKERTRKPLVSHIDANLAYRTPMPDQRGQKNIVNERSNIHVGTLPKREVRTPSGRGLSQGEAGLFQEEHSGKEKGSRETFPLRTVKPFPGELKVLSGEKGQTVLFCEHAKLCRFDQESWQWKERGVGDIKLLRCPKSGRGRVIMRRDFTKKMCVNHVILADMRLKPSVDSDCSWMWHTSADLSYINVKTEELAVTFASADLASRFKEAFDELKKDHEVEIQSRDAQHDSAPFQKLFWQQPAGPSPFSQTKSLPYTTKPSWTPVKIQPHDPPQAVTPPPAAFPPQNTSAHRILTPRSTLRSAKKNNEDCFIIYEIRPSREERERAASLLLPPHFYNFERTEPCSGCRGCHQEVSDQDQRSEEKEPERRLAKEQEHQRPGEDGPIFGQSYDFSTLSFSSVAVTVKAAFSSPPGGRGFPQARTQLFQEPQAAEEDDRGENVHFEPIIPLPEEIKVVTGEEGLDVLFCERAKLYRFDKDNGQWKEHGVGDIKLLRDPRTGCGRVIMRRDQIKKLCANHVIGADMNLKPNVGSDRSWVWHTSADYSEGDAKPEQLAVRFKSAEPASRFKEAFDELKEYRPEESQATEEGSQSELTATGGGVEDLKARFAPVEGSWSCDSCYTQNSAAATECVACSSPREGGINQGEQPPAGFVAPRPQSPQVTPAVQELPFLFNASSQPAVTSSTAPQKSESSLSFKFTHGDVTSTFGFSMPLFTIGRGPAEEDTDEDLDRRTSLSPTRISSSSKREIAPEAATFPLPSNLQTDVPFGAASPYKFTFRLNISPVSPSRSPPESPTSPLGPGSPSARGVESKDDKIYFEPLIPLLDKVERYTGEENETTVFCERARLYRYDKDMAQWKERGIGDMKILHHKDSNMCRLLMRREHVLKICCNHRLTSDMTLRSHAGSDRAWVWHTAADFADETAKPEMLAVRFRSAENAEEFKHAFKKAQSGVLVGESKIPAFPEQAASVQQQAKKEVFKNEEGKEAETPNHEGKKGREDESDEGQVFHAR